MLEKKHISLDKKDKRLLYWLDVDARHNYAQLAKKTGMSKQLVKYRIERLERQRIIKGYYPLVDSSRLGLTNFRIYLSLRNTTKESKERLLHYLENQDSVWALVLLAGKWDVAIGLAVKDHNVFHEFWDSLLAEQLKHIADYHVSIYSPIYHYSKTYLLPQEQTTVRSLGASAAQPHDDQDLQLLALLAKDARMRLVDIAQKLHLTPEAVSVRLQKLKKSGILQGTRAMIDVGVLGYSFFKAEIRLSSYRNLAAVTDYCLEHPNINQVDRTIGGETLELEFHVHDVNEMLAILQDMNEALGNIIERYDYLTVLGERKMHYLPKFFN